MKKQTKNTIAALLGLGFTLATGSAEALKVDGRLPSYQPVSGISGTLNSIGSDTLNNLMTLWAEGFAKFYPNVKIQIEGKGSSTAPPALISGTAQLGPMSRKMKAEERNAFQKKYGYYPLEIGVAVDALAVYAHKDNPVTNLTMAQIDSIFSSTRKRGGPTAKTWGDIGLTGEWATKPLSLYGRNSASGTYGFFKEHVLKNGDYKNDVKEQPGSASVVQGVEKELNGIGYSGIGYKTSGVKTVAVDGVNISMETAESFEYPISRLLYVYVNKNPSAPTDPLVREFIKYVLSKEGQEVTIKDGYFPMPEQPASEKPAFKERSASFFRGRIQ
jgi:phosphate transport system substrate-binding protein